MLYNVSSPIIAFVAAGLTFLAFWVQYKANQKQREDISLERFERNFYEMIHLHQDIVNNLKFYSYKEKKTYYGRDVFHRIYGGNPSRKKNASYNGKYNYIKYKILNNIENDGFKAILEGNKTRKIPYLMKIVSYTHFFGLLDNYFRLTYRILKYVYDSKEILPKGKDEKNDYYYISIFRALLSEYELILIYYNGLNFNKCRELVEEYSLLNNLRADLLATEDERNEMKAYFENYTKKENMQGGYTPKSFTHNPKEGANINLSYTKNS